MSSLRIRLSLVLLVATGFVWLFASAWIYSESNAEIERVLDTRLQESARMVASLVMPSNASDVDRLVAKGNAAALSERYEHQLSCQIWSFDGKLITKSSGAPDEALAGTVDGFTERLIGGEPWRVFTVEDHEKGIRVMVGDSLTLRHRLITDLLKGLLLPLALIIPLLAFVIWGSISAGLRPIDAIVGELRSRSADDIKPLTSKKSPQEIRPLVEELNKLFVDVDAARQHERELTAFAAHELRTPLAGLKTQAQIAIATSDQHVREEALRQIVFSIDRTSRLIQQILTTARIDAAVSTGRLQLVDLRGLLQEIIAEHPSGRHDIRLELDNCPASIETNRELLILALRNLHENAIQHVPVGGSVIWSCAFTGGRRVLVLEDTGPGIPEDELPLVFNRFFRGRHKTGIGSGLGLAIVDIALKRLGATIVLRNRDDGSGLHTEITLPEIQRSGDNFSI
ncbi:ATP-binding protein [Afipia felis]|uniref:histidine kinase n=2 Tax=Afipia felis TaxID=1035 RepID=A0A380W5B3_AFIFE|nr:ATP-binding protein [Afipia felis]EKS31247.1 hypothetical protein HMPREF9697_03775 [Afipia felis ATCC 53690]SUU75989.1 Sensor protein qseC [Afipia felis]SUU84056.1 Sensor protein qseC [Afipia felis]